VWDPCSIANCRNGAACEPDGSRAYRCICAPGWLATSSSIKTHLNAHVSISFYSADL
ncbi:hypothetical protein CRUP_013365, partial [Coryphaenoides rupestris]